MGCICTDIHSYFCLQCISGSGGSCVLKGGFHSVQLTVIFPRSGIICLCLAYYDMLCAVCAPTWHLFEFSCPFLTRTCSCLIVSLYKGPRCTMVSLSLQHSVYFQNMALVVMFSWLHFCSGYFLHICRWFMGWLPVCQRVFGSGSLSFFLLDLASLFFYLIFRSDPGWSESLHFFHFSTKSKNLHHCNNSLQDIIIRYKFCTYWLWLLNIKIRFFLILPD